MRTVLGFALALSVLGAAPVSAPAETLEQVRGLMARLGEGSVGARRAAAVRLGELSSNANIAIEALARAAKEDPDHEVRMESIRALERISGQANLTVVALVDLLSDPDPDIRWAASGALESFGAKASLAVPQLLGLLDDPEPVVRAAAASTLGKMGPVAVAALIRTLEDPAPGRRNAALMALAALGARAGVAVPHVIPLTDGAEREVRRVAVLALRRIAGDRSWPGESGWLTDPKQDIWPKVMTSAERNREYPSLRAAIIESVIVVFARLVADPDPDVRYEAVKGFADLGPDGVTGADVVAPLLFDGEPRVRRAAAEALGAMGPGGAADSVPDLVSALGDPDDHVVWAAVQALRQAGQASVPELLVVLEYEDPALLPGALTAVIELGPDARGAAPAVESHLGAPSPHVRALAAEALGSIGAAGAAPALRGALEDEAPEVRDAAAWALGEIAAAAPGR